jgi:putative CocE/NonD family hydrolase
MPLERQPGALGIVEEFNVSVPARDGTKLSTNIFRPDAPGRFPALLCRTPYNKGTARHERLVRAGYVVAVQDTRGRYGSEGKFVPFTSDKTYDAQDGFDAVEWLARQPWCDGNVGTFGGAYSAWMQWRLAALRPPHLRAMCAWSIPTTLPALDWPGCYRVARRLQWWVNAIGPDLKRRENGPPPHTVEEALKLWADGEGEKWLWFRPWTALPRRLHGRMADYVLNWYAHPERDPWKFPASHAEITVPNLDFTGYYDHGNDTIGHFLGMRKNGKGDVARQRPVEPRDARRAPGRAGGLRPGSAGGPRRSSHPVVRPLAEARAQRRGRGAAGALLRHGREPLAQQRRLAAGGREVGGVLPRPSVRPVAQQARRRAAGRVCV